MLRRALKLHEGKLSLRHGSEDQNPIRQPVQLFERDLAGLPARSLLWSQPAFCVLSSHTQGQEKLNDVPFHVANRAFHFWRELRKNA